MRLGCFLMTISLLVSLLADPPKAKAFALEAGAVYAIVGAFITAVGLTPVITGAVNTDDVGKAIGQLLDEYLNSEVGQTLAEWGAVFEGTTVGEDGKMYISRTPAEQLYLFAKWAVAKYVTKPGEAVKPGVHSVFSNEGHLFKLADGTTCYPANFIIEHPIPIDDPLHGYRFYVTSGTTKFLFDTWYQVLNGHFFGIFTKNGEYELRDRQRFASEDDFDTIDHVIFVDQISSDYFYIAYNPSEIRGFAVPFFESANPSLSSYVVGEVTFSGWGKPFTSFSEGLALDVAETMQQVLDRLSALEEGQSVALDVGATQAMELQEILQNILEAILAGDIAATAEVVEVVDPVDPDPPVPLVPDVDGLGLPALGEALTSRFPFCIPWDVYKGVQLLAAPAKAPYFEVDFMAPIAERVGGWKGSTKIVLDFSEYEIIGQVCRWSSTIGFCLMLATATKRLIWTA